MPRRLQLVLAAESYISARLMSNRRIPRGVLRLDMKQGQNLAMHDAQSVQLLPDEWSGSTPEYHAVLSHIMESGRRT